MTTVQHGVLYTALAAALVTSVYCYGKVERAKGASDARVTATEARLDTVQRGLADSMKANAAKTAKDSVASAARDTVAARERVGYRAREVAARATVALLLAHKDSGKAAADYTETRIANLPAVLAALDAADSTVTADSLASQACSVARLDCAARNGLWARRYTTLDSLDHIHQGQRPTWLQREEGPLVGAAALGAFILGVWVKK